MVNNRAFFISPMIGELKLRKSELVRPSRYLMVMRFFHFPILALRLHSLEWSIAGILQLDQARPVLTAPRLEAGKQVPKARHSDVAM